MRKIGTGIDLVVSQLSKDDETLRKNLRGRQVRQRFKDVMENVYREHAGLFLAHTNNVYIMDKDGVRTLIVYVDESIFAAELNAQRELIRLKLLEKFEERVERFEIYVSKGTYKKNHPFVPDESENSSDCSPSIPLDAEELSHVCDVSSIVEDEKLRHSLKRAMMAGMEQKKGELNQYPET